MISFLADENISPETADYLESLGYPCRSLCRDGPRGLSDAEIVQMARAEGMVILTHDLDFGEIYHSTTGGAVGVIVLRLKNQTVEAVNRVLERFFQIGSVTEELLQHSLVVLSEDIYRIYRGPRGPLEVQEGPNDHPTSH